MTKKSNKSTEQRWQRSQINLVNNVENEVKSSEQQWQRSQINLVNNVDNEIK